jgi:uncharacterized membrane protein (UPF0127 family)
MKPQFLLLIALLVLAGCQSDKPDAGKTDSDATETAYQHVDSVNRTYHLKDLQRVKLEANGKEIPVWVMDDEGKRREGMMWLTADDVSDDDGMLFAFPDVQPASNGFWMENTILALDIMYISEGKKVLDIQEGSPHDETSLKSSGDYKYVLEMKRGAAKRLGIAPGTLIMIPNSVKAG